MRIEVTGPMGGELVFDWDPGTGRVSGPDAWWIDRMLALWDSASARGDSAPPIPDPRYSKAGMAFFLSALEFPVPDELRAELPSDQWPGLEANA
jgi:hypothetical protein